MCYEKGISLYSTNIFNTYIIKQFTIFDLFRITSEREIYRNGIVYKNVP